MASILRTTGYMLVIGAGALAISASGLPGLILKLVGPPRAPTWSERRDLGPGGIPENSNPSPSDKVRVAGEFEPQQAIVVASAMLESVPETLVQIIESIRGRVRIIVLVRGPSDLRRVIHTLMRREVPWAALRFVEVPHDTIWVRDYGPRLRLRADGTAALVDSGAAAGANDRLTSQRLAQQLGLPNVRLPLRIDGGNLLTNGSGLFLSTEKLEGQGLSPSETRLRLGVEQFLLLEPLEGELTGHVDMFATFTSRNTAVVGEIDPETDPVNAAILDRNAMALSRVITPEGPIRVVRVPMGPRRDGIWRTYTNVVYANGALLVPVYTQAAASETARVFDVYSRLLPGWEILGIETEGIARKDGGLHCLTCNLASGGSLPRFYFTPSSDTVRNAYCGLTFVGSGMVALLFRRGRRR